ncbi:MAG TPA: cellulose binding domain-containing protein, partial [Polyangia bacterium]|nr:cellulose binding domain-containing protein [Polyangia bacterium]
VDAAASCSTCKLKVQYECRQNGPSVAMIEYSIKVVNTGTTAIPLSDVSVRYWYTIDGTGGQAGSCNSTDHPCTVTFQSNTPAKTKADELGVISFSGGMLAPGADTGEVQIEIFATGMYTQTNDYSFTNSGANFLDETNVTGYIAGKLVWGTAP